MWYDSTVCLPVGHVSAILFGETLLTRFARSMSSRRGLQCMRLCLSQFGKTSMDGVFAGGDNMDFRQQLSVVVGAGSKPPSLQSC